MSFSLLQSLCCPFCGGPLKPAQSGAADYDTLTCRCARYPVVAGIPVIKRGAIGVGGETVDDVNRLIDAGRHRDALLSLILPPAPASPALAPSWIQALPSAMGFRRVKRLVHQRAAERWREQAAAFLTRPLEGMTACDVLDLYYHRSGFSWNDAYDYFALRFGQPRHLVALSFATLIERPKKPVLDLACGFGHITRTLARRAGEQPVIGIDETFVGLYVARNFIAPEAIYVCCVGDGPLPFPDGFFSTAFCSDAFHYFANKVTAIRELKRLTRDDGFIVAAWMHNVRFRKPHDGLPLPPEGYEALVADMPHRMVADSEVLSRYLRKLGAPLARSAVSEQLSLAPLVSVVASYRQEIFKDYGAFEEWPHGVGRLALNPLYSTRERSPAEEIQLRRAFPSDFYIGEHAESKDYMPETARVNFQALADLEGGRRTAEVERLVGEFVALGIPDRYR